MLTKQDLDQIKTILHTGIQTEARNIVREEIVSALKPIKKDITQIRSDQKAIINVFDREYLDLRHRVERIEEHLNLSPKN